MPKRIKYHRQMDDDGATLRDVARRDLVRYFYLSIPGFLFFTVAAILAKIYIDHTLLSLVTVLGLALIAYVFLRRLAMGSILMYKAYAPMDIRSLCRFQPSCSTYALISIARYGILLGCTLALLRIRRCRPPYGGEDFPALSSLGRLFCRKK